MSPEAGAYTHGHAAPVVRSHSWRTIENSAAYLLPHLRPGQAVLDVGCGPGTITWDLAARVAPGRVLGMDTAEDVLVTARANGADRPGVQADFRVGDVYALELEDDSVDVVHAHQVLQHLTDPVGALREMRRVCRPGGIVAVRDADYQAMTWAPASAGIERWLSVYRQVHRGNGGEPDAGRHLLGWAHAAGFTEITASASAWCFATREDRAWWSSTWAARVTTTKLADDAIATGLATRAELAGLAEAWHEWAAHPDAWFAVLHGELLCRA
jgi:SAM-dependent methyltransferase